VTGPNALDQRARRAAKRAGLVARKTRWRVGTVDNWGGYQLIDAHRNLVVDGPRFDLSAEEIITICEWQQVGDAARQLVEELERQVSA
jgi:hypothetical protein